MPSFTPIKNVRYSIENTRVEQRTDFEKLIMEVSTDGTIHPEEAVKQASRILIQHLMIITDENITFDNKEEKKEDLVDEQTLAVAQDPEDSAGRSGSFRTCIQLSESCKDQQS